jgi:serine/threonine protein kinase
MIPMPGGDSSSSGYPFALPADFTLEEYRIVRVLGQGGFGITYLAHDTRLATDVAIKELLPRDYAIRIDDLRVVPMRQSDEKTFAWAKQRFIQEARTLAKLNHPNIARVFRFLEDHGTAYMVMEFVRGKHFKRWIREHRKPSEADLQKILLPLLDGLEHVHQQGLLHRDISPENIFVTEAERPVLLDFGNARTTVDPDRKLTDVVRPGYSPIEQYQTVTPQGPFTDLYALAGVMIYAITGSSPPLSMDRLGDEDPCKPLAQRYRGRYTEGLLRSLDAAFAVQPEDRPQSVSDWRRMLAGDFRRPARRTKQRKTLPRAEPAKPSSRKDRTPSTARHKKRMSPLLLVLFMFVLIAGGAALYLTLSEDHIILPTTPSPTPQPVKPSIIDKEHPYVNSLGMEFVPVPGKSVLFCVEQTRKRDYAAYVKARQPNSVNNDWKNPRWLKNVEVGTGENDPVVMVSWYDANAFCDWLSESESKNGVSHIYRLPSKDEWSSAVVSNTFPWGNDWPPPAHSGNFADLAALKIFGSDIIDPIPWYEDGYATTAPVKSFKPNRLGLYDLGSNVQEWCSPMGDDGKVMRRGASWKDSSKEALACSRTDADRPDQRSVFVGFRCVLEIPGGPSRTAQGETGAKR